MEWLKTAAFSCKSPGLLGSVASPFMVSETGTSQVDLRLYRYCCGKVGLSRNHSSVVHLQNAGIVGSLVAIIYHDPAHHACHKGRHTDILQVKLAPVKSASEKFPAATPGVLIAS